LNEIKDQIIDFQGPGIHTELQKVRNKSCRNQVASDFAANHMVETVDLINDNCHLAPKILEWQFSEAVESIDDDAETYRQVIKDYKKHKKNIRYNDMIEKSIRTRICKNARNKKA